MNHTYPWKQAALTGLIVSIFAICFFIFADHFNRQFGWGINTTTIRGLTGLLTLVILAIGIYIGMRSIKLANGGILSYGQSVLAGFTIAVTVGIVLALVDVIYCNYLNPGYAADMVEESKKAMIADGKSSAEIAASMSSLKQQWTTMGQMLQAFVGQTVFGTVISLVMGVFIKTKK